MNALGELESNYPKVAALTQSTADPYSLTKIITGGGGTGGFENPGDNTRLTRWNDYDDPNYLNYGSGLGGDLPNNATPDQVNACSPMSEPKDREE